MTDNHDSDAEPPVRTSTPQTATPVFSVSSKITATVMLGYFGGGEYAIGAKFEATDIGSRGSLDVFSANGVSLAARALSRGLAIAVLETFVSAVMGTPALRASLPPCPAEKSEVRHVTEQCAAMLRAELGPEVASQLVLDPEEQDQTSTAVADAIREALAPEGAPTDAQAMLATAMQWLSGVSPGNG